MSQVDDIPAQWQHDQALSIKDGLAMLSFLIALPASLGLACFLVGNGFGPASSVPIRPYLHSSRNWLFLGMVIISIIVATLAGKYLWLVAMCRILDKSNVGPLIAYGLPRRISGFDRGLVNRLYKPRKTAADSVTSASIPKTAHDIYRLHGIAYTSGAIRVFHCWRLSLRSSDYSALD